MYDSQQPTSLIDYEQYYLDLPTANAQRTANWSLNYAFRRAYGTADVSASSLNQLLNKLKSSAATSGDAGDGVWAKYEEYWTAGADVGKLDCVNRHTHLCAIEHLDYAPYDACIARIQSEMPCSSGAVNVMLVTQLSSVLYVAVAVALLICF